MEVENGWVVESMEGIEGVGRLIEEISDEKNTSFSLMISIPLSESLSLSLSLTLSLTLSFSVSHTDGHDDKEIGDPWVRSKGVPGSSVSAAPRIEKHRICR